MLNRKENDEKTLDCASGTHSDIEALEERVNLAFYFVEVHPFLV